MMEEHEHEQSIQALPMPRTPGASGPEDVRNLDNHVYAAKGFAAALLLWGIGIGSGYVSQSLGMGAALLFLCFNIGGPGISILVWLFSRKHNRPFARGALVFGVVSLVVIGGCWVNFRANLLQPPAHASQTKRLGCTRVPPQITSRPSFSGNAGKGAWGSV